MAAEVREWAITAVMVGGMALGIYIIYNFAKSQGWITGRYMPRLTRMRGR